MRAYQPQQADFIRYWDGKHASEKYAHPPPSPWLVNLLQATFLGCMGFVLDHGCGIGRLAEAAAREGIRIALNDISGIALTAATERFHAAGLGHRVVWKHCGNIETWDGPVPWGGIISHRVLHCLPREARRSALRVLSRGLLAGGKAIVTVRSTECSRFDVIQRQTDFVELEHDKRSYLRRSPFRFLHFYTREEFLSALADNGLVPSSVFAVMERTGNLERDESTAINTYWLAVCTRVPV